MNKGYKILVTASLLSSLSEGLFGPFYAIYVENIGGSILDIGQTMAVFAITTGILMMIMGKVSDKINKQFVVILGYVLYALGTFGYLIINNTWQLFILQIIFAIGTACLAAPWSALFSKFIQKKTEGLQWGLEGGGQHIIFGLAVFVGTFIINQWGFGVLFFSMFLIHVCAVIVQSRLYFVSRKN
ncbi:MAG: MFS transporter [Candidatus Paceibacterota bacterium]|jgi:MFS family permease